MEVKIPLDGIGTTEKGSLWKFHVVRYTPTGAYLSLDGIRPYNKANYRAGVATAPLLRNGTFEVLSKDGTPANWSMDKGNIIKHRTSHTVKLSRGGYIYQLLAGGELGQKTFERKIRIRFRASGKGVLRVYAMRYSDTPNGKAQYRYTRKFIETQEFFQTELAANGQVYSCEYTIKADEWIGLRFVATGTEGSWAMLDDISIVKIAK